ncbi:MAG: hypothetical protein LBJ31_05220 [Treponema sp.]|nr:hypothetical protein [Treponema sp.]
MLKYLYLLLFGIFFVSCNTEKNTVEETGNQPLIIEQEIIRNKPEIDYKTVLDEFLGYYLYVPEWATKKDIIILEVSFDDFLMVKELLFVDEKIVEKGSFILDTISHSEPKEIYEGFTVGDSLIHFESEHYNENGSDVYVYARYTVDLNNFYVAFNILPNDVMMAIDSDVDIFVKNYDDIEEVIHLYFSYDAQKKYTGIFIPLVEDMEKIREGDEDEIVISINDYGRLEAPFGSFLVSNNKRPVYSTDGSVSYGTRYTFYDENTIVYTKWESTAQEDHGFMDQGYTITYKRKNGL